jgi:hypothetical protein
MGMSEATFYNCKKKGGGVRISQFKELERRELSIKEAASRFSASG